MKTELNENHKSTLLIGFRYVDGLLSNIEEIMATSMEPRSPFDKYIADITPEQQKAMAAEIKSMRAGMCRILEDKGVEIDYHGISAVHAVRTALHFADIAIEERRPKYMKGYGELSDMAAMELNKITSEMQKQLRQLLRTLQK